VFQSVDLQNLDTRKATNSNIKMRVFENLDKSKRCRGPLVSLRRHLNGARSLASHAYASCSATCRRPELRRGRPRVPPRAPRLRSKARLLHLYAFISAPPLSPRSLCSASRRQPLFQASSTATGSHCCHLVYLHVIIDWGSARQAGHHSEPTGRRPSRRSPPTKLHRPPPRTSTT
jgi:hypothetical protein